MTKHSKILFALSLGSLKLNYSYVYASHKMS